MKKLAFTNILAPPSPLAGVQYTDMDFLSRENSRVTFFLMSCLTTCGRIQMKKKAYRFV